MSVTIRPASIDDLSAIADIYNYYVVNTVVSFDLAPVTIDERREWFQQFALDRPHRLFVAEEAGKVVGYSGSFRFRTRKAYDTTVETTVYCAPEAVGRGIGRLLYDALFDALRGENLHVAIAAIAVPNPASIALHERFGFTVAGQLHDVGRKFDRYWDVVWYEKRLP